MAEKIEARDSAPNEVSSIERVYADAFPDEDLVPLVKKLLKEDKSIVRSILGITDGDVAGHGIFTTCGVIGTPDKVALLAPLAVAPHYQRQGIGTTIVCAGLRHLEQAGINRVFVLGDPTYYRRFGIEREDHVEPPYTLPEEWLGAWQSLNLQKSNAPLRGKLSVPKPWLRRALWEP